MKDQSLTKQAGLLSATESFRFIMKSLIGIVLARMLTPEDYGSYRQLFLIYTTFSTVLLLGIPQSMLYFIPKISDDLDRKRLVSRIVDMISILALLMFGGILIFRGMIAQSFSNPQLSCLLLIFAGYPIFMFLSQVYSSIMMGMKRSDRVIRFTLFTIVTDFVLILGTALFFRKLEMIVLGLMLSAFLQWIYVRLKLRTMSIAYSWDKDFYKEQFSYSLPLGLSSIIGVLTVQLDKFVISGFFSPAQYAIFSIGAMELPFVGILTNSVNSVILPAISSHTDKSRVTMLYRAAMRKNALLIIPIAALCFVLASDIISILYSDRYSSASIYFQIYLIALLVRIGSYGILFQALNRTKYILYNAIFTLSLNLGLNLILVNTPLKMKGPAIATVIVTYASMALYLYWIKSKLKFQLGLMIPWLQIGRTLLSALIAGLISFWTISFIESIWLNLIIGGSIFSICYLAAAYLLGAILPYDIASIKTYIEGLIQRTR